METIDTRTFAEPWDIGDVPEVLAGLERGRLLPVSR
jgi:hypothetical protein